VYGIGTCSSNSDIVSAYLCFGIAIFVGLIPRRKVVRQSGDFGKAYLHDHNRLLSLGGFTNHSVID
jgi:hypothetical protein